MGPVCFQAGFKKFCVFALCYGIFCCVYMLAFIVLDLVFQYKAKRLAAKNVFEMTYFVSGGT